MWPPINVDVAAYAAYAAYALHQLVKSNGLWPAAICVYCIRLARSPEQLGSGGSLTKWKDHLDQDGLFIAGDAMPSASDRLSQGLMTSPDSPGRERTGHAANLSGGARRLDADK